MFFLIRLKNSFLVQLLVTPYTNNNHMSKLLHPISL